MALFCQVLTQRDQVQLPPDAAQGMERCVAVPDECEAPIALAVGNGLPCSARLYDRRSIMTILDQLPLVRLHFQLQSHSAIDVPAYKGDMLRRALLWRLPWILCQNRQDWLQRRSAGLEELEEPRACEHCQQPHTCLFARLCEPPCNPAWSLAVQRRAGRDPPPAYAVWDLRDRRTRLEPGDQWSFELLLVGKLALQHIPAFVTAVQEAAEMGMVPDWGPQRHSQTEKFCSRLRGVWAIMPVPGGSETRYCLMAERPRDDGALLTWQSFRPAELTFGYRQALACAESFQRPLHNLSLHYLSPVKIRDSGQQLSEPQFGPLMRRLVWRLRALSEVHGGGEWPHAEYGSLLDLAETVRLEHQEICQAGFDRWSGNSGGHRTEGFVGQAWYAGEDLRPLLPILWLGQCLHVGKEYTLGNGRYAIELPDVG
jgi:hypothetical protein